MSSALELIRVRGHVQGVGFRPTVAVLAKRLGLRGWVKNDAEGVLIALLADEAGRNLFVTELLRELPPLARVRELTRTPAPADTVPLPAAGFEILLSDPSGGPRGLSASIVPDAAICSACRDELTDAASRRFQYAFGSCTHCGPRFSIARALPWDRARTSLAEFPLCAACSAEYHDPNDRRYHAEPIACAQCGPRVRLSRIDGTTVVSDLTRTVAALLGRGEILALKGIGGFQLLVDATQEAAVARLRRRKQRPDKPFALMGRDVAAITRFCELSAEERAVLESPAAPIVILQARGEMLAPSVTGPVSDSYGFMLPSTPLHVLALSEVTQPVVCTSGNRSEEPQISDDAAAFVDLAGIADWILGHDRPIAHVVDDSVVRVVAGRVRVLRRARGLAPAPVPLPPGFAAVAQHEAVLATGSDLKAAICLSRRDDLVLSQHLGDLDELRSFTHYRAQSAALRELFEHVPTRVVTDNHRDARAATDGRAYADEQSLPSEQVSHHHAHFAACLGENGIARESPDMLGIVLDGIGTGEDGRSLWGGEVFIGTYVKVERVGTLSPVALLGGDRAAREPWRCLYAQLRSAYSWQELSERHGQLSCVQQLQHKPIALLEQMLATGLGAPMASSCGRLFDAVAAVLGVCFEAQTYEAQAARSLESLVTASALAQAVAERERGQYYELPLRQDSALCVIDTAALWRPVLVDLSNGTAASLIAARFHVAIAAAYAALCEATVLQREASCRPVQRQVALSGGCLQNACLYEQLTRELDIRGFSVISHAAVPANDGGIALGQALVSLARAARAREREL